MTGSEESRTISVENGMKVFREWRFWVGMRSVLILYINMCEAEVLHLFCSKAQQHISMLLTPSNVQAFGKTMHPIVHMNTVNTSIHTRKALGIQFKTLKGLSV